MDTPHPQSPHPTGGPPAPDPGEWVLLDAHPSPYLLVETGTGRVVRANAAARACGLHPPADGAFATDERGCRIEAGHLARDLSGRAAGPGGCEVTWHTPDCQAVFRVFARSVPPEDGSSGLTALAFLDVTGEKKAEAELRNALEARDEFFSVATHELKDPLFSLQLSIQFLRHSARKLGEVPGHVLQHLEVSQRQSERLARLIDNLLDASRILNHRVELDVEAVELSELTRETVARYQERAESSGTNLEVEAPGPVVVYADRLKLEQVLSNLLSNALKMGWSKREQK